MLTIILNATVPVFGLILIGYCSGRFGLFQPVATDLLNRFVVFLALPALLFQAAAESSDAQFFDRGFLIAFGGGVVATFLLSLAATGWHPKRASKRLSDRSIEALSASYANTAFMGIPVCLAALGPDSLPAAIIASLITVSAAFAVSIILIELDLQGGGTLPHVLSKVLRQLARNPLVFSPLLGFAYAGTGSTLPSAVHRLTSLLGGAASPTALVTIGLFLSERHKPHDKMAVFRAVALKLSAQPLVTALLAFTCVTMPRLWLHAALLLAAMPIGTGPFMLAKLYGREAAVTSRAILISTVLSLFTLSLLLAWLAKH